MSSFEVQEMSKLNFAVIRKCKSENIEKVFFGTQTISSKGKILWIYSQKYENSGNLCLSSFPFSYHWLLQKIISFWPVELIISISYVVEIN